MVHVLLFQTLQKSTYLRWEENMDGWTVDKLWCCLPYFFYYAQKVWHRFDNKSIRNKKTQGGYQFSAWSLHVVMDTSSDNSILVS